MKGNRIIVHTLIESDKKYLVTKRSKTETTFPEYWDIPGGLVDIGELPKDAVIREIKEETNLDITPTKIIHEDSNFDKVKDMIFIRLVYLCELNNDIKNIKLNEEEHTEYRFITSLEDLKDELISPFLIELLKK